MGIFDRFKSDTATTIEGTMTAEEWYAKGNECAKAARYKEALRHYDKALKSDPECARAWNDKAAALDKLGRDQEAFQCARKAAEINPRYVDAWKTKAMIARKLPTGITQAYEFTTKARAIEHCNKGEEFANAGDYKTALYWYDRALGLEPDDETAVLLKQQALAKLGPAEQ